MGNHGVCNSNIILELGLNSSMVLHNTTKKPCSLNFDPSLTLALSGDRDLDHSIIIKKKTACDHGGLYRQNSVSTVISEVEEEDDNDNNSVNGRKKLRLTKSQSALLEEAFKHHSSLNPKQKQELARELKLRARQVEVWFQNRRARTKLKQT
ncbi:homeobox-leucine zipper protein HAT9-like isoform X2 [Bidens hawaiensis]|uniref:homeobox-leucine zipper protein HAT9-like isoform X2 n=1 Tax=Bidens hawaiensis TaxID=980011 RepID=UPI0040497EEB